MMIKYLIAAVFVIGLVFLSVGCNDYPETSQAFQVSLQPAKDTKLLILTSDKYYFKEKEKEVRAELEQAINSGQYNIVSVKTSYSSGRLTAAEITYDASGIGEGNNIRILLVLSDKCYYDEREKEVKPKLNEVMNGGQYDIVKVQTIYVGGRLLAAEVYYRIEH